MAAGDLTLLCQQIQAASSLLTYAKVLAGKNALASVVPAPRIVVFVTSAANGGPDDVRASLVSGWMLCTARLWAKPNAPDLAVDTAFDLRTRFFQALRAQADAGGYFWKLPEGENERWDTIPDTTQQGQEFEIDFVIRVDANKEAAKTTTGTVAATSMAKVATLTAGMGSIDVTAPVDATFEEFASGVLHIDDEQMSYSGMTATSFTGLVRGINGTTAATHASGTAVYVSPT